MKETIKEQMEQIWVPGHECVCAYIGYACTPQLYAYTHFEYAHACIKHAHAYTPRNLNPGTKTEN